MKKLKLLNLTNTILPYRIPVYNLLSKEYDLTVAHFGEKIDEKEIGFKQIVLNKKTVHSFIFFKENIRELAQKYDVILALPDLHIPPYFTLGMTSKRKFALVFWSIGVSASYSKKFDKDRRLDKIRFYIMNKADAIAFYSDYPIKRYVEDGKIDKIKLFVANNTVEVNERITIPNQKKYYLFVGTLYRAKKIFDLLLAYEKAYKANSNMYPLYIIGDGEERNNIEVWIKTHNLEDKIFLIGPVFNQTKLKDYYTNAVACISPGQAGLTVLNSMAYGVPFVTTTDAITGGEIFNIINQVNGILYEEGIENLVKVLLDLNDNHNDIYRLSKNAQDYYFEERTIFNMVKGLSNAIDYAYVSSKNKLY